MTLTDLELEFLQRLSVERWISPPLFDHALVARLVEAGLLKRRLADRRRRIQITDAGRGALAKS